MEEKETKQEKESKPEKAQALQASSKDEARKRKKDKLMFGGAVIVLLGISILTSKVNLLDELNQAVRKIWSVGQEAVAESEEVETLSKGGHVEIVTTQVVYLREIYEVLGEEIDESQAISILQEIKTLAYYGRKQGISASSSEIEECKKELRKKMEAADSSAYKKVAKRYGGEKDYWVTLKDELEEYVISEKLKEEKREEFSKKRDADVEKDLEDYINKMIGYENFKE